MSGLPQNPFRVPHAANLNDAEIDSYWVDLGDEGGFEQIFRPTSLMPMIVLGGKGSGKTHLMRHFSFELQQIRSKGDIKSHIQKEKYIGIYLRASGLHTSRFKNKADPSHAWIGLFAYYVELWFTERLCSVVSAILPDGQRNQIESREFMSALMDLFDDPPFKTPVSWNDFVKGLSHLRRSLDNSINNCFSDTPPNIPIVCSRGALIFGLPKILTTYVQDVFHGVTFTWLVDEYEHFYEGAQRYINTLIREKQQPSTFKVGVRLWGIYTFKTFSNEEILKQESEYEELHLDERLRSSKAYPRFAMNIVQRRLERAGWTGTEASIKSAFADEAAEWENKLKVEANTIKRPWLERLRRHLTTNASSKELSEFDIAKIISLIEDSENPFLEKLSIFLFYRAWSKKTNLLEAANLVYLSAKHYSAGQKNTDHEIAARKFKSDLLAQTRRELQLSVMYTGFDSFVQMSSEVVRSLLVILKKIYDEALYSGERMFEGQPVCGSPQSKGVSGASEWFFEDVLIYGDEGLRIRAAIERLGRLFRSLRFCEKPSECSLNSFSLDPNTLTPDSAKLIDLAVKWSVFIPGESRIDRNSAVPHRLYRLSGMLCPKFDLPLSSRGNIALTGTDIEALFDIGSDGREAEAEKVFTKIIADKESRCIPPFRQDKEIKITIKIDVDEQPELFGGV